MTLRFGSLFAGIGGFDLGFANAGMEPAWMVEKDSHCQRILRHRFPGVPLYDDVTEVTHERLRADLGDRAAVDVLVGGFPCQDLSLAGRRRGMARDSGSRSALWWEFHRLAAELTPRWLVVENVPGLLSSRGGRDFGALLGSLAELGRGFAWRVLDAQFFGVPQRRRRVFIVGHLGAPWSAPAQVLLESEGCIGDPQASQEEEPDDAAGAGTGSRSGRRGTRFEGELDASRVVHSLVSEHGGPDLKHAEAGHLVPLFEEEAIGVGSESTGDVAGTLGPPGGVRAGSHTDLDRMGALVKRTFVGEEFGEELARALLSSKSGYRSDLETENLIVEPVAPIPIDIRQACRTGGSGAGTPGMGIGEEGDPAYSVTSVVQATAYSVFPEPHSSDLRAKETDIATGITASGQAEQSDRGTFVAQAFRKVHRAMSEEDAETWDEADKANTLNTYENHTATRTTHAIVEPAAYQCHGSNVGEMGTLRAGNGEVTGGVPFLEHELAVRRLTPMECERLQGFPDGWTEMGDDGKPMKDSARYRMLGNAVAVPCAEWIARRLIAVDAGEEVR